MALIVSPVVDCQFELIYKVNNEVQLIREGDRLNPSGSSQGR